MWFFYVFLVIIALGRNVICKIEDLQSATLPKLLGCLSSDSLCKKDQLCLNYGLFGKCVNKNDTNLENLNDDAFLRKVYSYELLGKLAFVAKQFVTKDVTWKQQYTKCIVQNLLLSYASGTIPNSASCKKKAKLHAEQSKNQNGVNINFKKHLSKGLKVKPKLNKSAKSLNLSSLLIANDLNGKNVLDIKNKILKFQSGKPLHNSALTELGQYYENKAEAQNFNAVENGAARRRLFRRRLKRSTMDDDDVYYQTVVPRNVDFYTDDTDDNKYGYGGYYKRSKVTNAILDKLRMIQELQKKNEEWDHETLPHHHAHFEDYTNDYGTPTYVDFYTEPTDDPGYGYGGYYKRSNRKKRSVSSPETKKNVDEKSEHLSNDHAHDKKSYLDFYDEGTEDPGYGYGGFYKRSNLKKKKAVTAAKKLAKDASKDETKAGISKKPADDLVSKRFQFHDYAHEKPSYMDFYDEEAEDPGYGYGGFYKRSNLKRKKVLTSAKKLAKDASKARKKSQNAKRSSFDYSSVPDFYDYDFENPGYGYAGMYKRNGKLKSAAQKNVNELASNSHSAVKKDASMHDYSSQPSSHLDFYDDESEDPGYGYGGMFKRGGIKKKNIKSITENKVVASSQDQGDKIRNSVGKPDNQKLAAGIKHKLPQTVVP